MILLDFSGTMVASIMGSLFANPSEAIDEDLVRHMILNSIAKVKQKFKGQGRLIICCDGKNYWRKEIFPYYKCKRKVYHDSSAIDWKAVFAYMDKIKLEVAEVFTTVEVDRAEADDIIATLAFADIAAKKVPVVVSRDKDLKQLQLYGEVIHWNPIDKRLEVCDDPKSFLAEHIICGDSGDSVPNIFSRPDSFALKIRQKAATAKRIEEVKSGVMTPDIKERYDLNEKLIDLKKIPDDVVTAITDEVNLQINKKKSNLLDYFLSHNLRELAQSIQNFA